MASCSCHRISSSGARSYTSKHHLGLSNCCTLFISFVSSFCRLGQCAPNIRFTILPSCRNIQVGSLRPRNLAKSSMSSLRAIAKSTASPPISSLIFFRVLTMAAHGPLQSEYTSTTIRPGRLSNCCHSSSVFTSICRAPCPAFFMIFRRGSGLLKKL